MGQSSVTCPPSGMRSTSRWYSMSTFWRNRDTAIVHACLLRNTSTASYGAEKRGHAARSAALPGVSACVTSSGDECLLAHSLSASLATNPPSTAATAAPTAPSNRLPTANALAGESAAAGARRARGARARTGDEEPPGAPVDIGLGWRRAEARATTALAGRAASAASAGLCGAEGSAPPRRAARPAEARTARMTVWRSARVDRTRGGVEGSRARNRPLGWPAFGDA